MLDLAVLAFAIGALFFAPWLAYRWLSRPRTQHKTLTERDAQLALYGGRHERVANRAASNHNGVLIHGRD